LQRYNAVRLMNETGNTMSSEWTEQPAAGAQGKGSDEAPGKILAAQREAMGWTVEQVADQLKLAVRQVVALEAGDSAGLPGPAVVRGFVRAYAKIVRLDPAPLVAKIALDAPGPSDATHTPLRHGKTTSFSEVRFPSHGKRASFPIVPVIAIVVLAGAGAAAWHFGLVSKLTAKGDTSTATSTAASAPGTTTGAVAPPLTTAPAASAPATATPAPNLQNPSVPLISVPPPSAVTPGSPAAGQAATAPAPAAAEPATAAPAAVPGANTLVLTVNADSWVEVRRAKGAPLLSRLLKAGSTESVEVTEPVTLVVGKPDGITATLRGAPLPLPATKGAVAKLNVK
jgi:cytoskeleton protein RodZ